MSVITLKHLAREFNIDPFKLRRMFRKKQGLHPNRRWRWQEGDHDLAEVRSWLRSSNPQPGQSLKTSTTETQDA